MITLRRTAAGSFHPRTALDACAPAVAAINAAGDLDALARVRTTHVSGRGAPRSVLARARSSLARTRRRRARQALNALTTDINEAFERRSVRAQRRACARVARRPSLPTSPVRLRPSCRAATGIRSRLVSTGSSMSSLPWVTRSAEGPEAEHAGSTRRAEHPRPITPHAAAGHPVSRADLVAWSCCAHRPHRCRCAPCWKRGPALYVVCPVRSSAPTATGQRRSLRTKVRRYTQV